MKKVITFLMTASLVIGAGTSVNAKLNVNGPFEDTYLSEELVQICENAERVYSIDAELLEALIETESSGKQYAVNKAGDCIGYCQLNPKYMKSFTKRFMGNDSFDWYDPEIQVYTCCEYLNYLKDLDVTEGDIYLVLQAYNCGPENITGQSKYADKITERAYEITMANE